MDNKIVHIFKEGLNLFLKKWESIRHYKRRALIVLVAVVSVLTVFYIVVYRAPADFPVGGTLTIEEGSNLNEISWLLEREGVVRSSFLLKNFVRLLKGEHGVFAGDYYFHTKISVLKVAKIITQGDFGLIPVKITIPEGSTVKEMVLIFEDNFDLFNGEEFLELATPKEGYLFPDTYFFLPTVAPQKVIEVMEENFTAKIKEISNDLIEFEEPFGNVVIMASLLEKEARTTETRRTIAGILWNRMAIGMPLQVDATFLYINGKNTFELSLEDLKVDSPYNTYLHRGLPWGPIANPGLNSLKAAVTPIETSYLYYLSDLEGGMHYGETFEEHKRNKELYLR